MLIGDEGLDPPDQVCYENLINMIGRQDSQQKFVHVWLPNGYVI